MAKIYFKRIIDGRMTMDDVPARWHDETLALVEAYYASMLQPDEAAEAEDTEED